MINVLDCFGRNRPNLRNGESSEDASWSTNALIKRRLKQLPRKAASPCRRKRLDSIVDHGIGHRHLGVRGKTGDECSRSRCAYLWRIAGEDHDNIVKSTLERGEDTTEGSLTGMKIGNGTIDTPQRGQAGDVSPNGNHF
jgi:hypothetical protein